MDKLILVTGATGYIASRLIPRLLEHGYLVRALARNPLRLKGRAWFNKIDIVQADVTSPSTLANALNGVHTAYYLIHNMSHGHGYTTIELDSARAFTSAAERAGVEHIIYLGGLADPEQHIAPHMRSRIETGKVLRESKVPVTEFRAGVITGSGSISFEMIRFMTELCPIVPGPMWLKNKSQPIATQNVIDYLFAALTNPNGRGGVFEIGGPDVHEYSELMVRYARARGLKRFMFLIPGVPLWFMAFGVGLMTPVPYTIAYALIGGLSSDSVVKHPDALKIFPEVQLIDFDAATQKALGFTHPDHIERVWVDGDSKPKSLKHEGCFILHSYGIRELAPAASKLADSIREHDSNFFGELWLEQDDTSQTLFFSPRGLPGFLYWYLLYPFHWLRFHILLRKIAKPA
ncbi:MAG: NAD(P)H-binding protein [Anaerolineales bacterium]|nr:NAD(P)H-binding protein [Anaerolineales bacterium]